MLLQLFNSSFKILLDAHTMISLGLLVFSTLLASSFGDYYWRDWTGAVPADAYQAGKRVKIPTYVGQVFVDGTGLFVGDLKSGDTSVSVAPFANKTAFEGTAAIKVLSVDKSTNYQWVKANSDNFDQISADNMLVLGGQSVAKRNIYIGKDEYDADHDYVCSIYNDNKCYYVLDKAVRIAEEFSVLAEA